VWFHQEGLQVRLSGMRRRKRKVRLRLEAENLDAEMRDGLPPASRRNNPEDRQSLRALQDADYHGDKKGQAPVQDVFGNGLQEQGGLGKKQRKEICEKESGRKESNSKENRREEK